MTKEALNWLKVTISHPPVAAEAVSALLFDEGASGVWEDRPDEGGRQVTRAGFAPGAEAGLKSMLPERLKNLAEIFELPPTDFNFSLELEEDHDWAEKWKEGLKPIIVSSRLAVAPTWWPEEDLPERRFVLRLDPGLAFGSGHHATTWLCLSLLDECAPAARRILDVGSGSGILALAAARLNEQAEITGIDNDLETISVALENALANNLEGRINFSGRTLYELSPPFDLIVANITLGPLVELAPAISTQAAAGGRLILSGLLTAQAEEAAETYTPLGWRQVRRLDRDEWSALLLERAEAAGGRG